RFPALGRKLVAGYRPPASCGDVPWTELARPLSACRVALVTTAGIHHKDQPPFDMTDSPGGDLQKQSIGRIVGRFDKMIAEPVEEAT
ncbi:MAG TPA: hypothetical protein VGA63_07315, partial [Geopsychrobacteraceae bacterium]